MTRNLDKLTVLERGSAEVVENNLDPIHLAEKARGSIHAGLAGKICNPEELNGITEINGLLFEESLLDLSDLEDEEPIDLVNLVEPEDSRQTLPPPPKTEKKYLAQVMADYLESYPEYLYGDNAGGMPWMHKKRLPFKAYEFDDAVNRLWKQQEKRSSGEEPEHFAVLEAVRSLLGGEFIEEVRKCHFTTEDDFSKSVGNRVRQEQMDYIIKDGSYNPEFANDMEKLLERRQEAYTELNTKLKEMSLEYALIDIDEVEADSNMTKTSDTESDDLYFGTQLMDKVDKMLESGASPDELKRAILIAIKQSVHHEMTTLCRDNNEMRIRERWISKGRDRKGHDLKIKQRGIDENLEPYPLASFDALFSIAVRVARKSVNNATHRDNYLLGEEVIQRKKAMAPDGDDELSFEGII